MIFHPEFDCVSLLHDTFSRLTVAVYYRRNVRRLGKRRGVAGSADKSPHDGETAAAAAAVARFTS